MNMLHAAFLGALIGIGIAGVYVISKGIENLAGKLSEIIELLKNKEIKI